LTSAFASSAVCFLPGEHMISGERNNTRFIQKYTSYIITQILLCYTSITISDDVLMTSYKQHFHISGASIYQTSFRYRYIELCRIDPVRPPQYRFCSIYRHVHFLFLRVDFILLDSNASNKEFSYE